MDGQTETEPACVVVVQASVSVSTGKGRHRSVTPMGRLDQTRPDQALVERWCNSKDQRKRERCIQSLKVMAIKAKV